MDRNERRLLALLKERRLSIDELAIAGHVTPKQAEHFVANLSERGARLEIRGKKEPSYHLNVLPQPGNTYTISGASPDRVDFQVAAASDFHIASIFHLPKSLHECLRRTEDAGIDVLLFAGDLMDGMGIYKGHEENLSHHGAERQTDEVARVLNRYPKIQFLGIAGNHDYSITQKAGIKPLAMVEAKTDNFKNLGDMRADVEIHGIRFRLLHGAGGRNYARSYPSQTYLRDFFGGLERHQFADVPHVMTIGHYHTLYSGKDHGIHILQAGSFQDGDNEYCVRRGLTGPTGLFHLKVSARKGQLEDFCAHYIEPKAARTEKGSAFAKTSKSYARR